MHSTDAHNQGSATLCRLQLEYPCLPLGWQPDLMHALVLQEAFGKAWVLYDMAVLAAMLVCVISYSIYIRSLADFRPQDTYPVYDSLGGAQARLLLPKKQEPSTHNGETSCVQLSYVLLEGCSALYPHRPMQWGGIGILLGVKLPHPSNTLASQAGLSASEPYTVSFNSGPAMTPACLSFKLPERSCFNTRCHGSGKRSRLAMSTR